jgi:hypothetical protein
MIKKWERGINFLHRAFSFRDTFGNIVEANKVNQRARRAFSWRELSKILQI